MTDPQIIELIRTDKSDKALTALYRHFPMMLKLVRSNGGNRHDENRDSQNLRRIYFPVPHHQSPNHDEVARDVRGEEIAETQETSQVNHARNDTE